MRERETASFFAEKPFLKTVSDLRLPLPFVPMPEKRRNLSPHLIDVAAHELNHVLAAHATDTTVVSVSVIPEGKSLGRTILACPKSPQAAQIIAAAGCVPTHDGTAQGYGSDLFQVSLIAHLYDDGISIASAKDHAQSLIASYPTDVRQKAAEIIAFLKNVSGHLIPTVLTRAQMEVDFENNLYDYSSKIVYKKKREEVVVYTESPQKLMIIDDLGQKGYAITYVVAGQVKKEEFVCRLCQKTNGHEPNCPANT